MKVFLRKTKMELAEVGDFMYSEKSKYLYRICRDSDNHTFKMINIHTSEISITTGKTIEDLIELFFAGNLDGLTLIKSNDMELKQIN